MKNLTLACIAFLLCTSCSKTIEDLVEENTSLNSQIDKSGFKTYIIKAGEHNATGAGFKPVETTAMNFAVRFDSSAIYQSKIAENQEDINKLYGFSDNGTDHHQFSARIGWSWSRQALRLYAYVYNNGVRIEKEITTVPLGQEIVCSIKLSASHYVFSVGNIKEQLPRMSTTPMAKGYQLYPYFGGNETPSHDVRIMIKDL